MRSPGSAVGVARLWQSPAGSRLRVNCFCLPGVQSRGQHRVTELNISETVAFPTENLQAYLKYEHGHFHYLFHLASYLARFAKEIQ